MASAATCCHLALWCNAAVAMAGTRGDAIRKAPADCGSDVRITLEESAVGSPLARDAGHLRKALNMVECEDQLQWVGGGEVKNYTTQLRKRCRGRRAVRRSATGDERTIDG